ncbi:PITH domain-containing protein 1 [Thoreauomyces humboldtii]|nr:PITH domain-containing protein 1 [Thoreauomyces humboldtii]
MSHCHDEHQHHHHDEHGGGGGAGHEGHDHDGPDRGFEFGLYAQIDTDNVRCLNEVEDGSAKDIFKTWEERWDVTKVRTLTLYFPDNFGSPTTRITYIGLRGEWSEIKQDPVITVYELAANPADHKTQADNLMGSMIQ